MGFGKFQSLVSLTVLVLQVAVVGLVGANSRTYLPSILQSWACEPSLDALIERTIPTSHIQNWALCSRIRGGRLAENDVATANQTDDATETKVVEEKSNVSIPDYSSSEFAFSMFQEGDGSKTDPDGIPEQDHERLGGRAQDRGDQEQEGKNQTHATCVN